MLDIKCVKCGFPFGFSKIVRWNNNGTISDRFRPDLRVVIMESNIFNDLIARIEKHMGLSISHIVFEAQRNAGKEVIDSLLNTFPFTLGRIGLNKKLAVRVFCTVAIITGQSYAKTLHYQPGESGEAIIRNPFNRELMAAIILGAFESLERKPFEHRWIKRGEDDIIAVSVSRDKPEISQRLALYFPSFKPGNLSFQRCRFCGAPSELSYLEWREKEGIIVDHRRDVRVVFLDGYTPTTVFRELEKELGEDIYPLILRAQKETTHRHLDELKLITKGDRTSRDGNLRIFERLLAPLPLWGQGNPTGLELEKGTLKIAMENPYNEHLLAGHIAAVYEAVEGEESEVSWSNPDPFTTVFDVRASH